MNKPMLAALTAVALTTLTTAAVPTLAAKAAKPAVKAAAAKPHKGGGAMQKMADALGLTADQKTKIKTIQDTQKTQSNAIKADASLSYDAKTAKLKALKKSTADQMKGILTPAQQAKMQQMRDARKAKA